MSTYFISDLHLDASRPAVTAQALAFLAGPARSADALYILGDLFEAQGIRRDDPANLHAAMFRLAMAAAEAGVYACDGAHPDFREPEGFEHEARMAQGLGFIGKSCIHPRQVEWAHAVFTPSPDALAWARRVVAAAAEARARSLAAFALDGRMVDRPYLQRAERLLAQAGELPDGGTAS